MHSITCVCCGKTFQSVKKNARYCSDFCRSEIQKRRASEKWHARPYPGSKGNFGIAREIINNGDRW